MTEMNAGLPATETWTSQNSSPRTPEQLAEELLIAEQHQQKLQRERERRTAKKLVAATEAEPAVIMEKEMTQAERDRPYRQRLSARIKADDAARAKRIAESQERRAASKHNISR